MIVVGREKNRLKDGLAMPGIAGIIGRMPPADMRRLVRAMLDSMKHEPFYETSVCATEDLGVCAGWVAHPGSFASRQSSAVDGPDAWLVFAGECFEDASTATESVLERYERLGEGCVVTLNGSFSGLIADRQRKRVLLFNDRYGLERVYFHQAEDVTYFASEAKALLHVLPSVREFDDEGVAEFLRFGCVLGWKTLFRGITCLEGGSLWSFSAGLCGRSRYFRPDEWGGQPSLTEAGFEARFSETFREVLPRYTDGDLPLGISLTGGLDTRMIMATLPRLGIAPVAYTFTGSTGETVDDRLAARVAAACGVEHRLLRVDSGFLDRFADYVDRTVYVTDGCAGTTRAHEIYLNSQARRIAPVRLTGNFGSEVLRGMSALRPIGLSHDLIDPDFRTCVDTAGASLITPGHPAIRAAFREIPWALFGSLAAARSQLSVRTPYLDNDLVALACRAPGLQSPAAALRYVSGNRPALSTIPTDRGLVHQRAGLGRALSRLYSDVMFRLDYLHTEGLPTWLMPVDSALGHLTHSGLLSRHKYLPYRHWFRNELAPYVREVLTDPRTLRLPYWKVRDLPAIAQGHINGRSNYVREIDAVLTLAAADRLLLSGQGRGTKR